jgi:hypothetical protein
MDTAGIQANLNGLANDWATGMGDKATSQVDMGDPDPISQNKTDDEPPKTNVAPNNSNNGGTNAPPPPSENQETIHVGRWMSQKEYDNMVASGEVQPSNTSGGSKVTVNGPEGYKNAPKGDIYVEFDIPANTQMRPGGGEGWFIIDGPTSFFQ